MMNEKVKQIIVQSGLSSSEFADQIHVQRSSISHILANRNKPSFDILQKIIKRFPELGYDWLSDDSVMPNLNATATKTPLQSLAIPAAKRGPKPGQKRDIPLAMGRTTQGNNSYTAGGNALQTLAESAKKNTPDLNSIQPNLAEMVQNMSTDERKVERIIVFYSDNSFKEYRPY